MPKYDRSGNKYAARCYIAVMNNPNIDCSEFLENLSGADEISYVIGQLEKGDKEGTLHL